jgi:hypothetical protein
MALSRHTKHIINLYICSSVLLIIGAAVVITGIVVSINLRDEALQLGRELSVLEEDKRQEWGDIPGVRNRDLRHQFSIFNITNPRNVTYGQKPLSMLIGPWTFDEERDSENIYVKDATDFTGYTGELFHYNDFIKFFHTGNPENGTNLNTTFYVYNQETFAMLYSHRAEEEFMRASRALSTMINYTSTQVRDSLILFQLKKDFYNNIYANQTAFYNNKLYVLENYGVSKATLDSFWKDKVFGFSTFNNLLYWGSVCDEREPYREQFLHDYFYIDMKALDALLDKI